MHICKYVYTYIHIYTQIFICIYTSYTCTDMHIHIYLHSLPHLVSLANNHIFLAKDTQYYKSAIQKKILQRTVATRENVLFTKKKRSKKTANHV